MSQPHTIIPQLSFLCKPQNLEDKNYSMQINMGKQNKRASQQKTQTNLNLPKPEPLLQGSRSQKTYGHVKSQSVYFYREYPLNPFKSANDELNDLKSELMEAVEQILNEYYKDFVSRKKKILSLQKLCDHTRYNLIVEKKHQLRLQQKVQTLVQNSITTFIFPHYEQLIRTFISKLSKQLLSVQNLCSISQVVCLDEAYHTLVNAADQMSFITKPLFQNKKSSVNYFKIIFHELIMSNYKDLVSFASKNPRSHRSALEIVKNNQELEILVSNNSIDSIQKKALVKLVKNKDILRKEYIDQDDDYTLDNNDAFSEILQNMSVDQVVKYINGPKRSKRRDNKARTKQKRKNIDKEVEEFRKKLETVSPVKNRIKPNVTEDFIVKINELLKARALKKSLFSNLGR